METRPEIPQEIFNEMLDEAVEDLCKSGLRSEEIIDIIETQFGIESALRVKDKTLREKRCY